MNTTTVIQLSPDELRAIVREEVAAINRNDNTPKYYTRKETCERLHISLSTLDQYDTLGLIKSGKIGTRKLYSEEEIQRAVKEIPALKYQRK